MKKKLTAYITGLVMLAAAGCANGSDAGTSAATSAPESPQSTAEAGSSSAEATDTAAGTSSAAETTAYEQTTEAPAETVVMLETETDAVVNEEPVSYASFGIDKAEKEAFREEMTKLHTLPVINITTKDSEDIVSLNEYTSCVVDVFNCDPELVIDEASAGIRVRGNSSAFYGDVSQIKRNQVPYRIKFDSKTNMLGLNDGAKCKSWVLLKSDWDLIRNDIALRFGRAIMEPDGYYCSDATHVMVYVNDVFKGIYTLCEQCQINPERVDITEPAEGYTGTDFGYYLELDNYATSDPKNHYLSMDYGGYTVTDVRGTSRKFVSAEYSIKNDLYTQGQIDFIEKYMNGLFEIVYRACEKGEFYAFDENYDPVKSTCTDAKSAVDAVMDLQSVVDMYILYEIVHDYDCGEGSFFMCVDFSKDSNCPRLRFTSPWDFNWAYNDSPKRYWAAAFSDESFTKKSGDRSNPWFIVLMKQDWFADMVKEKWASMNAEGIIEGCVDREKEILETYRSDLCFNEEWAVDSAYQLLGWIEDRIKWLDGEFIGK